MQLLWYPFVLGAEDTPHYFLLFSHMSILAFPIALSFFVVWVEFYFVLYIVLRLSLCRVVNFLLIISIL